MHAFASMYCAVLSCSPYPSLHLQSSSPSSLSTVVLSFKHATYHFPSNQTHSHTLHINLRDDLFFLHTASMPKVVTATPIAPMSLTAGMPPNASGSKLRGRTRIHW
mmetsp:Transcript_18527/g.46628  ORF Transcript_18527/g.46628 Transcript_18527/m.46628 type:complete len:106 (+) Transcript_18527:457-774(+)